jgi:hypothetical protein
MHFGAQFLQPLLVADAEMLLLVDDDEAKVLEANGFAQDRVGADDDVDCAFSGAFLHLAGLRRADHARELADADRQAGEAIAEVLGMLAREQGRRCDDHGLLAVDRGGERGAQRDLGLAETDVAADEPVHRPSGGQIVERRLNRALLVRRLLVGKAGAEFVVEALRNGEARRGVHHPLGGDTDELAGHFAHALLEPRLARLPARAPEPVELAGFRAVARQQFEVFDRQEEPVTAGVVNLEAVVRRARGLDRLKADEAPDAMVDMNDEVAGGERARLRQHVLGAAPAPRLADEPVAENVLLADDGEVRRLESLFERDHGQRQRAGARRLRLMIGRDEFERFQAMLGEHVAQALARAVAPAGNDDVQAAHAQRPHMGDRGVEHVGALVLPLGGEVSSRMAAAIDGVTGVRRRFERGQPRERLSGEPLLPLAFAHIEAGEGERLIVRLDRVLGIGGAAGGVIVGDEGDTLVRRLLGAHVEHERRVSYIVVERVEAFVEER